jgi:type I restriction enzyme S subunit
MISCGFVPHDFSETTARCKRYFLSAAKQTTGIASINMTQLKKSPMLLPPLPLQQTFADRVQQIEALKQSMTASLRELEQNFQALMQEAFG